MLLQACPANVHFFDIATRCAAECQLRVRLGKARGEYNESGVAAGMQWPPAVIWTCKIHARSCKRAPSAVDLFAGSDILAPWQDNVARYDVMNRSKTIYSEMVDIISRYATDDGEHTTSIDGLIFGRRTSPTQLLHTSAQPCFALAGC